MTERDSLAERGAQDDVDWVPRLGRRGGYRQERNSSCLRVPEVPSTEPPTALRRTESMRRAAVSAVTWTGVPSFTVRETVAPAAAASSQWS